MTMSMLTLQTPRDIVKSKCTLKNKRSRLKVIACAQIQNTISL